MDFESPHTESAETLGSASRNPVDIPTGTPQPGYSPSTPALGNTTGIKESRPQSGVEMKAWVESDRDAFSINIFLVFAGLGILSALSVLYLSASSIAATLFLLLGFVIWRHLRLKGNALEYTTEYTKGQIASMSGGSTYPTTGRLPAACFLYVMGSGGHTTEMCEMIRQNFSSNANQHRRYVSTTGDHNSLAAITRIEAMVRAVCVQGNCGTNDHFEVRRARAIHQPLYTAWFTSIISAFEIIKALTSSPDSRPYKRYKILYKFPHVVITNGPGTGFILCLVAHFLKIFYLVPQNRLKLVYVESWAHTQTLSLTGKLFHWTGIANLFCVQHAPLAAKYPGTLYYGTVKRPATAAD